MAKHKNPPKRLRKPLEPVRSLRQGQQRKRCWRDIGIEDRALARLIRVANGDPAQFYGHASRIH